MTLQKTKDLMSALLEAQGQYELKNLTGQEIMPLRKGNSGEMDRVLKSIEFPEGTPIRIDYGKNKFRVVLGLSNEPRGKIAYIFMISNDHKDFSGKNRR
jgi:hypothetical protein